MYVIVYKNNVILGPMDWRRFRFQDVILEDCEVSVELPNNPQFPLTVNDDIKIYEVQGTNNPEYNPKIQRLQGPFWEFTDKAIYSYIVEPLPVDSVKNFLISVLATERYKREISGVKTVVNGTEITVETNRETRNNLMQRYVLMEETDVIQWKFNEGWVTLTKSEASNLVRLAGNYIQEQFDWELQKLQEIEIATTLEELDAIDIVQVQTNNVV